MHAVSTVSVTSASCMRVEPTPWGKSSLPATRESSSFMPEAGFCCVCWVPENHARPPGRSAPLWHGITEHRPAPCSEISLEKFTTTSQGNSPRAVALYEAGQRSTAELRWTAPTLPGRAKIPSAHSQQTYLEAAHHDARCQNPHTHLLPRRSSGGNSFQLSAPFTPHRPIPNPQFFHALVFFFCRQFGGAAWRSEQRRLRRSD